MVVAGGWGGSRLSEFQLFALLECQRGLGNAGRVELTGSKGVIFEVEVGVKSVQTQKYKSRSVMSGPRHFAAMKGPASRLSSACSLRIASSQCA